MIESEISHGLLIRSFRRDVAVYDDRRGQRCMVLSSTDGMVQLRILVGAVTRTVLGHHVKVRIKRQFMGDKFHNFLGPREIPR